MWCDLVNLHVRSCSAWFLKAHKVGSQIDTGNRARYEARCQPFSRSCVPQCSDIQHNPARRYRRDESRGTCLLWRSAGSKVLLPYWGFTPRLSGVSQICRNRVVTSPSFISCNAGMRRSVGTVDTRLAMLMPWQVAMHD